MRRCRLVPRNTDASVVLQTLAGMTQCLAQARTTFPAAVHYRRATVHAHTDAMAPPECNTRPQQLRLPTFDLQVGDFVEVRVPGNLEKKAYEAGVTEWESDGVTPHVMVAKVTEIFEDATVRAAGHCSGTALPLHTLLPHVFGLRATPAAACATPVDHSAFHGCRKPNCV